MNEVVVLPSVATLFSTVTLWETCTIVKYRYGFLGWLHFHPRHKRNRWFTFSAHRDKRPTTSLGVPRDVGCRALVVYAANLISLRSVPWFYFQTQRAGDVL